MSDENDVQTDLIGDEFAEREQDKPLIKVKRRYKEGINRHQPDLIGYKLDDFVDSENPVRVIDAFVDSLNLKQVGFTNTQATSSSGQPAYSPNTLLKLYLYGYQGRIRSTRHLARECRRNVEVMWLLRKLSPEYRTIGEFRANNAKAIRSVHKKFIGLCRQWGLLNTNRVSIDGSHFKGNVSAKSFVKKPQLNQRNAEIDREISQWIEQVEKTDADEAKDPESTQSAPVDVDKVLESIETLKAEKDDNHALLESMEEAGFTHISRTDVDAQRMSKQSTRSQGYNIQIAVDDQSRMIVTDAVTSNANDREELFGMANAAKEALGVSRLEALADMGYSSGDQFKQCYDNGITPFVPIMTPRSLIQADHRYKRDLFTYDKERDVYVCPMNELLHPIGNPTKQGAQKYRSRKSVCGACRNRSQCLTQNGTIREVMRSAHEELMAEHRSHMEKHPDVMRERAATVEHPFGTIKARAGWSHFLVRGREKVEGEWSLMGLGYNLTRALNILGIKKLITYCRQQKAVVN